MAIKYALLIIALVPLSLFAGEKTKFDKPEKKIKRILGASELAITPPGHIYVECSYYPKFMIAETVDEGSQGAQSIALINYDSVKNAPDCQKKIKGEIKIDWAGYFAGVRGKYFFLLGDDGYNGGMPFGVFSTPSAKKLFDDSYTLDTSIDFVAVGEKIGLRYSRAITAKCILYPDKTNCWEMVRLQTGTKQKDPPDCATAYRKFVDDMWGKTNGGCKADKKCWDNFVKNKLAEQEQAPPAIDYTVEVADLENAKIRSLEKSIACRASD